MTRCGGQRCRAPADRAVGEVRHPVEARRAAAPRRAAPTLMKIRSALQDRGRPTCTSCGAVNPRVSGEDRALVERSRSDLLEPVARPPGDRVLPRLDPRHVDARPRRRRATPNSAGPPRHVRRIGAGHHRLGRNAAGVHAGAAEQMTLDDRDPHAGCGQAPGQWRPGLPGADDDRVECLGHACS